MKRFLSILLALVMVLSLVACGNKTTPDTPDTPDKQEETIHIGIVTGSVSSLRTTAAAPQPSSSSTVRGTSPS